MAKNIVIFSDGTGQRGGVLFDESRSNIYKLYRATRCAPDSSIDPREQLAFYDAGIGTAGSGQSVARKIYNILSQATGLGLTLNIIDCYTEILKLYEPGDRLFLFGFSRGAYTVRCVAAVICLCGVPSLGADGKPLRRDEKTLRAIAGEAVKNVYQHVSSPQESKYKPQREWLAERFRTRYKSDRVYPYFIGVFDTVAAVASPMVFGALALALLAVLGIAGYASGAWFWILPVIGFGIIAVLLTLLVKNFRYAPIPEVPFLERMHFNFPKMRFADTELNDNVRYARHALAIDEHRKQFDRVPWANKGQWQEGWLKQIWFAGNHSDVGGSYPENEARLSDIALRWMVHEATSLPDGTNLSVDESVLRTCGVATAIQHDECFGGVFRYTTKIVRPIHPEAILHESVYKRLGAVAVLHFHEYRAYRPENLKEHQMAKKYFIGK